MPGLTDERNFVLEIPVLASYSYVQPSLVYYPDWVRILIPSFVSGYAIVDLSEIIASVMGHSHIFIEMVFAGIGCIASLICGIFEIYQWASWLIDVMGDSRTVGWQELLMGISCLVNGIVLLVDFVRCVQHERQENLPVENAVYARADE